MSRMWFRRKCFFSKCRSLAGAGRAVTTEEDRRLEEVSCVRGDGQVAEHAEKCMFRLFIAV
jgi:hypothetical protein